MQDKRKRFMGLFDNTFFRMSFQFLAIVFVAFLVLIAVGAYEAGGAKASPAAAPDTVLH